MERFQKSKSKQGFCFAKAANHKSNKAAAMRPRIQNKKTNSAPQGTQPTKDAKLCWQSTRHKK